MSSTGNCTVYSGTFWIKVHVDTNLTKYMGQFQGLGLNCQYDDEALQIEWGSKFRQDRTNVVRLKTWLVMPDKIEQILSGRNLDSAVGRWDLIYDPFWRTAGLRKQPDYNSFSRYTHLNHSSHNIRISTTSPNNKNWVIVSNKFSKIMFFSSFWSSGLE